MISRPHIPTLLALMGTLGLQPGKRRKGPLEGIDLEAEYELILKKKSKLSAALRKQVITKIKAK